MSTAKRFVDLGWGQRCSLRAYVKWWHALKREPPHALSMVPGRFDGGTAAEALRELRAGMHDRINQHAPSYGRGRKWDSDWQRTAHQTARAVNTPRLIVRWVPFEFRARLAHRLWSES